MRIQSLAAMAACVLVLNACREDRPPVVNMPSVGQALPEVLFPPDGELVQRSGSEDALQLTFRSRQPVTAVAAYYRSRLSQPGWLIVSDVADSTGAVAIHAESDKSGHPMWIRISSGATGTEVDLIGAVPGRDTTFARKMQEARDSSNVLRPR